jgi:hypothetical protein
LGENHPQQIEIEIHRMPRKSEEKQAMKKDWYEQMFEVGNDQ